jgi:transcriptional regulator with XRE-family HTH domain
MPHDPQTLPSLSMASQLCVGPAIRKQYDAHMARNEQERSEQGYELLTVQCRMARAASAWGVRDLAGAAQVSAHTVARFERGEPLRPSTVRAIRTALEDAGCEFICEDDVSGPGMRMRKRPVKIGG